MSEKNVWEELYTMKWRRMRKNAFYYTNPSQHSINIELNAISIKAFVKIDYSKTNIPLNLEVTKNYAKKISYFYITTQPSQHVDR